MWRTRLHLGLSFSALSAVLLTAGCLGSGGGDAGPAPGSGLVPDAPLPSIVPTTRYDMANGCYALKSFAKNAYAVRASDGSYSATSATLAGAEPFFMKPTALGKYLFYAKDPSFMAVVSGGVGRTTAPADEADWTVKTDTLGNFLVSSDFAGMALAVDATSGLLVLAATADKFGFVPATGCTAYPEAQVNAAGETYKGQGVDKPVIGFADVHQHISATNFLGGAHYGSPFHRFGITEALKDCSGVHGSNGSLDIAGNFLGGNPTGTHDTVGWPTFHDWPERGSLMHESMYYKWIERTYKAGLRLLVNNLVENELLCSLETNQPGHNAPPSCNEMENAVLQAAFMHELENYIDAQQGGPGRGWFRIVQSPAEARSVINDGKLAVVLGIEISHLFNCNVQQFPGGVSQDGCDDAEVDTQLNRLYDLGVREMFPIHEFDNALGGNGIFDGFVLNVGNFGDTQQFWKTYDCPTTDASGNFSDYFYTPGAVMQTSDPSGNSDPITSAILGPAGQAVVVPIYPSARQCNARLLTDLGDRTIKKMMARKMIVEVDHLELKVKDQVMDIAAAQTPPYPVVSTHGGHGGISTAQANRILNLGGIIYPGGNTNGRDYVAILNKEKALNNPNFKAVGFGADTNGLAHQANPRGSDAVPVKYPFTLFKGAGWGPKFAAIAPVTFGKEVSGDRTYDINAEGWAHYGMAADFVEEVRIEGGQPALDALYNSAEAYLQMWEKTVNR